MPDYIMLYGVGYRLHVSNYLKDIIKSKPQSEMLLNHQYMIVRYFTEEKPRGLMLFHEPGTGKTMTGASLAARCLDLNQADTVVFISKQSLHNNFRETLDRIGFMHHNKVIYLTQNSPKLHDRLNEVASRKFVDIMAEEDTNLDGVLLIVDEAHNMFSSITNGSENGLMFYNMVMKSKKCRLLFMSGSPATKEPYELAIAFNMLSGFNLFGSSFDAFQKYFIQGYDSMELDVDMRGKSVGIRNAEVFGDRVTGLISHFKPDEAYRLSNFPKMYGPTIVKVSMSQLQFEQYSLHRRKERQAEGNKLFDEKKKRRPVNSVAIPKGEGSTYRMMSRQTSNVVFPSECMLIESFDNKTSTKILLDMFARFDELREFSPKTYYLLCMVRRHLRHDMRGDLPDINVGADLDGGYRIGPGVIYSVYLNYGSKFIIKCLEHFGFELYSKSSRDDGKPKYAEISGEIDVEMQAEYLRAFNDRENKDGSVVAILLISASAAEGIDCKRGAHIHYFEPFWHYSRFMQVIARVDRFGGHSDLPEDQRHFRSYVYLSDYPIHMKQDQSKIDEVQAVYISDDVKYEGSMAGEWSELTTDINIWTKSLGRQRVIDTFYDTLKVNALDCVMNYIKPDDCRICSPLGNDNEPLIVNDLAKHIEYGSKCFPVKKKSVTAYPFMYDDRKYMFYVANASPLDLVLLTFDEDLGEHVTIGQDDSRYFKILAEAKRAYKEVS